MDMECEENIRQPADVFATIQLAKLDPDNIHQPSQILQFTDDASNQELKLIELNESLVSEIEDGKSLIIRGLEDDSAVLCSDDKTYDVKKAGTSNILLMAESCAISEDELLEILPLSQSDSNLHDEFKVAVKYQNIVGWANEYFELKEILPCTSRILKLLKQNPYCGADNEDEKKSKYTLTDLLDIIQASEREIVDTLLKINSCCINGYWRILDFVYIVDCLGEMFKLIDAESWSLDNIPINEMCEKINDCGELVPDFIVRHLMAVYGSPNPDSPHTYSLNERNVCRFFAEMLLCDVGRFNLAEFLQVWEESVPEGMTTQENYLQGLALIDRSARTPCIYIYRVEDLPQDVGERFNSLFQHRERWKHDDILPYIEDLLHNDQTAASLLMRYARSSTVGGIKYYNSRKSIK